MKTLKFDPATREIVIDGTAFATTEHPSAQRGAILLDARCFSLSQPMWGIGLYQIIGSHPQKIAYELNRWKMQCKKSGANYVNWTASTLNNIANIKTEISYE